MIWLARMFFDKLLGGDAKLFDKRTSEIGLAVEPDGIGNFRNGPATFQE